MKKLFYEKQLIIQRIEAHRAVFDLETRVLSAEIAARTRVARQVIRLGRQAGPLFRKLRGLVARVRRRRED